MTAMRVLLATDGSPDAIAAAEWLRLFPLAADTRVLVLSVAFLPPSPITFPELKEFQRSILAEAGQSCQAARGRLVARWPDVDTRVDEGDARERILRVAEEWRPDLAVLGSRGLGNVQRALLGSVSLTAARHLTCPVLVTRGEPRAVRRIVAGVDDSEDARHALRFLAALPLHPATEITLVAVAERAWVPTSVPGFVLEALHAAGSELDRQRVAALRETLERAQASLGDRPRVRTLTPVGDPAREIAAAAAAADLVVVGSRGLDAMRRLFLGTVSERVLHDAPCPVLIVRG